MLTDRPAAALVHKVQIPQQTTLGRQAMYAGRETLQPFEVAVAFDVDELRLPFLPFLMPLLCDSGRTLGCVGYTNQPEPGSLNQSFHLSRRAVHVKANRAPRGDFFVGKHSAASLNSIRPPGFRMRNISHKTPGRPGRWHKTSYEKIASKVLSAKGRFFEASNRSKCTCAARGLLSSIFPFPFSLFYLAISI